MSNVKMFYLRPGQECLWSNAKLNARSLHDKRHKDAGPYGTSHSSDYGGNAINLWPKRAERFETWDDFIQSTPPKLTSGQYERIWVGEEYSYWPLPKSDEEYLGPAQLHEEVIGLYGKAYSHNGVQASTRADKAGDILAHPLQLAGAGAVIIGVFTAAVMLIAWYFGL